MPQTRDVVLMQPTLVDQPFDRDAWVFEEKTDGWRMLAYKTGDDVKLISRPGRDHTKRFADLVTAIRALAPDTLILDGEVAIFDKNLVSRFEWMRHGKPPASPRRRCSWPSTASTSMVTTFDRWNCGNAERRWRR